jgi:hypothetical protein
MTIDDLLDTEAIRQALAAYARGMDRQDSDLLLSAYWPDAWDAHGSHEGSPQAFAEFCQRHWPVLRMQHLMGQSYIELAGAFANVETYFVAHQRLVDGSGEYVLGGRYNDRFEKRDGVWKVLHRVVVFDWRKQWDHSEADASKLANYPEINRGATSEDYTWELFGA